MPFPNLIYRTLAEEPGRLETCWQLVSPGLDIVGSEALVRAVLGPGSQHRAHHRTSAVSDSQAATLRRVMSVYDRGNSCNAVLVALLRHGTPGEPSQSDLMSDPFREESRRSTQLPEMVAIDAMSPSARQVVLQLAALVDPTRAVVPSLFRHLAHEPDLLAAVSEVVQAADQTGRLNQLAKTSQARVEGVIRRWPVPVTPVVDPTTDALLASFQHVIPRMLAVSEVLRDSLVGRSGGEDGPP